MYKKLHIFTSPAFRTTWLIGFSVMFWVFSPPLNLATDHFVATAKKPVAHNIKSLAVSDTDDTGRGKNAGHALSLKMGEDFFHPLIIQAADRFQVDPDIVKAIIKAESGFDPKAISKKGAQGLMQLMPRTAKALGVKDSLNPKHNIDGGVKYIKQLMNRYGGDVKLALAAYNAGSRYVKKHNGVPPFKATHRYIEKVLKYYQDYSKISASAVPTANQEGSHETRRRYS